MKTVEVFAAYHAARHAEEALLDAVGAASRAGLVLGEGDDIVMIERAALEAMKAMPLAGAEAAERETIFAAVAERGDHSDVLVAGEIP